MDSLFSEAGTTTLMGSQLSAVQRCFAFHSRRINGRKTLTEITFRQKVVLLRVSQMYNDAIVVTFQNIMASTLNPLYCNECLLVSHVTNIKHTKAAYDEILF